MTAARLSDRLLVLRDRFAARSRADLGAVLKELREPEPDLASVAATAHRLAGSGGTLGFPAVSAAAAALENSCDRADLLAARLAAADLRAAIDALPVTPP